VSDDIEPGPHTEGGYRDMVMFGRCMERKDAEGNWHHIPYEEWNPGYVPPKEANA
jgi:hypothetical protein